MNYDDDAAAEFYEDPAKRVSTGKAQRRSSAPRRLTSHVPVRFDPHTIAKAKRLADLDGMTVSAWVRAAVEREIQRRTPSVAVTLLSSAFEGWVLEFPQILQSDVTDNEIARTVGEILEDV